MNLECEQIAEDNDWRIVIVPQKYVSFEAFAYSYGKWDEVAAVYFDSDEIVTTDDALAQLAARVSGGDHD